MDHHDPSQIQPYDPSSSYYPYYQYPYQHYYQQQPPPPPEEPPSIHPPGVPIPPVTAQINVQNHHYAYYTQGVEPQIHQFDPSAAYPPLAAAPDYGRYAPPVVHGGQYQPLGQAPYASRGRRGGGPPRGGRSGTAFRGGKGRGRGRGGNLAPPALQGGQPSGPVAWCELCRVDCNTVEILELHKNGKKHKKNLKVHEELQNLNKRLIEEQSQQVPVPEVMQENEESKDKNPLQENPSESHAETGQQKTSEVVEPNAETSGGRGGKRKMRGGGRGAAKRPRTSEGPRRPIEAGPKPKQMMTPLVCEMCNVKCESEVVFGSHIRGKKHLSNTKKFQGQQEMLGQAALEALYPALQALYPALQALYPLNPNPNTALFPPQVSDQNALQPEASTFHAAEEGSGSASASMSENQDPKAEHVQVAPQVVAGQESDNTMKPSSDLNQTM